MTLSIALNTIDTNSNFGIEQVNVPGSHLTYWAVYMDDTQISTTSTREKAEQTIEWMENWLSNN